jgi:lipoprotein-releasing system permease protein
MPFTWLAALRFLREGRAQTLLIVSGVAVGVAVIVFLTALITGLQEDLIKKTLGSQAHIVVRPPQDVNRAVISDTSHSIASRIERRAQRLRSIDQWQQVQQQLAGTSGVVAISPIASGSAFAVRNNAEYAIALLGVDAGQFDRVVKISERLVAGSWRVSSTETVIGVELARDLGASVGDKLRVRTVDGLDVTYTIAGLFDIGVQDLNKRWVFVTTRAAQSLLDLPGGITTLEITVDDIFAADEVAARISTRTGLVADSWMKTNAQLMAGLRSQSASSTMIQFFVIVAVAFSIASVLVVSVMQKSKEIGILRTMGAGRGSIVRIFLIQGAVLGLVGSLLGSLAGSGLALLFANLAQGPSGAALFPIMITPAIVLKATLLATLTGVLSAAVPALRAARLDPVAAIRYG